MMMMVMSFLLLFVALAFVFAWSEFL